MNGGTTATVDHLAYMTSQWVTVAQESASSRASQAVTAGAAAERDKMRLAMRTDPVANNESAAGRQMNRRVEIVFAPQSEEISKK